jgi:hypothetical protein
MTLIQRSGFGNLGSLIPEPKRQRLVARMSAATSGASLPFVPGYRGACHRATLRADPLAHPGYDEHHPLNQKGGPKARRFHPTLASSRVPGRSEAPPGLEGYFLAFFAFFAFFTFLAFFAFLAIASSFRFNGWKRDAEACSAEGQPRNILECNPNRFAGRCLAPSRQCHCVIHNSYAFWMRFCRCDAPGAAKNPRAASSRQRRVRVNDAATRPRICIDPNRRGRQAGTIHQFKTTAWIVLLRVRVR